MDDVKRSWELLSTFDPLWAIASRPGKEGNRWDLDEFMQTGIGLAESAMHLAAECGHLPEPGRMLDFGCGVGRVTVAFAKHFQRCDGIDVAEGMIDRAREYNVFPDRVHYHVGFADKISFGDGLFDLVYSRIVLQHMPVDAQVRFVAEFIRVLKPGGIAIFQTPSKNLVDSGTVFKSPIATPEGIATIDMNVFPRAEVEKIIAGNRGKVLCAREDQAAGPKFRSYTYVVARA